MAKQPVKGESGADGAPAKPRIASNPYFLKAANQAGMALATLATMVLNVPIFQHASNKELMGMVIFEVILMFACTASCGILAMTGTQNFARGIAEEIRRAAPKEEES